MEHLISRPLQCQSLFSGFSMKVLNDISDSQPQWGQSNLTKTGSCIIVMFVYFIFYPVCCWGLV
jgi:hypothetical protein